MQDDVKFIFKSLIKVPVIIFEVYFVFNIFCLMFIFFKTLGYSYVVMQTVVENNYVPAQEVQSLDNQLRELRKIQFVGGDENNYALAHIVIDGESVNPGNVTGNGKNTRTQYGTVKQCGVTVMYTIQWPLRPDEQTSDYKNGGIGARAVDGLNAGQSVSYASGQDMENRRNDHWHTVRLPITITYKVPGLQYYPDLNIS